MGRCPAHFLGRSRSAVLTFVFGGTRSPDRERYLGFSEEKLLLLNNAALIHDVGFLGLENTDLVGIQLNMELTDEVKFRLHPVIGGEMVKGIKIMKNLMPFILYHHRYINDTGFPENIPADRITPEIEVISILEHYFMVEKNKGNVDKAKFSSKVFEAFHKVIS